MHEAHELLREARKTMPYYWKLAYDIDKYLANQETAKDEEPVGWIVFYPDQPELGYWFCHSYSAEYSKGLEYKPLYLHPPQPEPARKPITREEIIQGVTVDTSDDFHAGYWAGIRYAEKHHFGMGVNPSDPDSIDLQSRCRGDKL